MYGYIIEYFESIHNLILFAYWLLYNERYDEASPEIIEAKYF